MKMTYPRLHCCISFIIFLFCGSLASVQAASQPYIIDHQVNFGTGNKYLSETDVRLSSPAGSFNFTRTYNSQSNDSSQLGYGWTATSTEKLTISDADLHLTQADGRVVYFTEDESGRWVNKTGRKRIITSDGTGYLLTEPNGTAKKFNSTGKLTGATDRHGNSRNYSYENNQLATITDNFGLLIEFTHTNGNLTSISTPAGTYSYGYTNENLTSVTKPDTSSIQYVYDDPNDPNNLTGIIDESQIRILTVEYDTEDRVTRCAKAEGESEVTVEYPSLLERTVTENNQENQIKTSYQLEVKQGVISVASMDGPGCSSCGAGLDISYTYNDRLQILTKTDGNEVVTSYTYDNDGNRDTITRAKGTANETTISKVFVPGTNRVQAITKGSVSNPGQQQVTTFEYYPGGNLWKKIETGYSGTNTVSRTTSYTYDAFGRVKTIDGPRTDVNDIITYDYYPNDAAEGTNRGHLKFITNAKGHTITFSNYNGYGKAEQIKDSNNITTTLTYTSNRRLNTRITAGVAVDYDYYPNGNIQKVTLPEGRTITYLYTPSGNIEQISDNIGNNIIYSYDTEGKKIGQDVYDPQGNLTTYLNFDYDDADRLYKTIQPDNYYEQLEYDGANNLVLKINQLTEPTAYGYDELNRLETVTKSGVTLTAITYDTDNNQVTITDAEEHVTSFTYDDFGRRLSRTSPDTGVTTYEYDEADNLKLQTDANHTTTTYAYDALNRLETISFPNSVDNVTYEYDKGVNGKGRLTGMTDRTGNTVYEYDILGRLKVETRTQDGINFTLAYSYNDNNETTQISYPSGRIVTYNRNIIGNVESVTTTQDNSTATLASDIEHKPFGPITNITLGNGSAIRNSYDSMYRLQNSAADTLFDRTYEYYPNSTIKAITDNLDASTPKSYTYDTLGRLKTAIDKHNNMTWNYDGTGNRLNQTINSDVTDYTYKPGTNQLFQVTGTETTNYLFDNAGNLKTVNNSNSVWSQNNRLLEVTTQAQTTSQYGYDGRGLRVKRTVNGNTLHSLYDTNGNLLVEVDAAGNTLREYVYLCTHKLSLFDYTIKRDFTVNISTSSGTLLEGVKVYAFNENNSYTGLSQTTDEQGQASFDRAEFGEGKYTFRVDYLGAKFWSSPTTVANSNSVNVFIEEETAVLTVTMGGIPQTGVKVYAFTESGSYLGMYALTGENGQVSFTLPEGENYTFRADLLGGKYWSDTLPLTDDGLESTITTGGGTLTFTVTDSDIPLPGIKTYLFTLSGSYLGLSATTDAQGTAAYNVPDGTFLIRADYLGYQFWSEESVVTGPTSVNLNIPHQQVTITVNGDFSGDAQPYPNTRTYLFSPSGSYLGQTATTDEKGQATYYLPQKEYNVRADTMGTQYWSGLFTWQDTILNIAEGIIQLEVTQQGSSVSGINTYLFHNSSYLGVNQVTDQTGSAIYRVPAGTFSLRADFQGNQYWGKITVAAHQANPLSISTGGVDFSLTLNNGAAPLEGVKTYLYSSAGNYLGETKSSDGNGQVGYPIADGTYKIRIDYLGYQYWTENFTIPQVSNLEYSIPHQTVAITAQSENNVDHQVISNAKVYLFTPAGSYQGINGTTDSNGQVVFNLPPQPYTTRLDYMGQQFWSPEFSQSDTAIIVNLGDAEVTVTSNSSPLASIKVYAFTQSGAYLGLNQTTDINGKTRFRLPAGNYKFRADYQSSHYWATGVINEHQSNAIDLNTGGGSLTMTVFAGHATILEGVKTYLFSSSGSYLGESATTDAQGIVSYDVADGSYKIRVDYLGYKYWSEDITVPETTTGSITVNHVDTVVTIIADQGTTQDNLEGIRCYLFTAGGSYTGVAIDTDTNGRAVFNVPPGAYKVRADYLGQQHWSAEFDQVDTNITILHGELALHVTDQYADIEGARVYLFSDSGSYLGRSELTGTLGQANFTIPEGAYKVRVDTNSTQYWSGTINIIGYQLNQAELELTELTATNNPRPTHHHGKPPVYSPLLAALGDITPLFIRTVVDDPRVYYFISDHLGTGQMLVDNSQTVVWQAEYTPFGKVNVIIDKVENNLRFPGQYFDAETGLHYNHHRYYDPSTGRYISADPIGLAGGLNLYSYANQNPINYIDPEGLNAALWKAVYDVTGTGYNDLYKHCYVSCKGNKMDGAEYNSDDLRTQSELTNIQLGLVEAWQTFSDMDKSNPSGKFEASKQKNWDRDMPSNRAGNDCAEDCTQTCEDCCSKYAGGKF